MIDSSAQQSGACSRINSASRSRMQTKQDEGRIALLLWMVPKNTDCGLPLFASTIATPVLRRDASMASTRIYRNVKIDRCAFNTESTNSKTTVLLAWVSNGRGDQENSQAFCRHRGDDVCDFNDRIVIFRHDKRLESNRDAGFGTGRRLFAEFPDPGQADCESVSIASRAGPDEMG